jgi:hypothetical protein
MQEMQDAGKSQQHLMISSQISDSLMFTVQVMNLDKPQQIFQQNQHDLAIVFSLI